MRKPSSKSPKPTAKMKRPSSPAVKAPTSSSPKPKPKSSSERSEKLTNVMKEKYCAVVAKGREAHWLCEGQSHIIMPFASRILSPGDSIYVVVHHNQKPIGRIVSLNGDNDKDYIYRIVARVKFVANRRLEPEKIFKLACKTKNALPVDDQELAEMNDDLGISKPQKTYKVWEVEFDRALERPVRVVKASAIVDNSLISRPLKPRPAEEHDYSILMFDVF